MVADVTLVNFNMLCVRYLDRIEREIHLPLGPLYLARSLEDAGYAVDFRDYQLAGQADLFSQKSIANFLADPSDILFVSCMANLLPFTLLSLRDPSRDLRRHRRGWGCGRGTRGDAALSVDRRHRGRRR